MSSSDTSASVRLTGRVKWFNNKTGFGFITIVGGNDQFKDASEIFAHHSAIKVSQEQYRYLVEGEYVEFSVSSTASGDHKFQAADVRGVKGGKLFCETRYEQRASAPVASSGSSDRGVRGVRSSSGEHADSGDRAVRGGGGGGGGRGRGRGGISRGGRGEWMLVRKDAPEFRDGSSGRGGGRVYSSRPSGHRQPRESSLSESFVEHTQPQSAPAKAPTQAPAPAPAPTQAPAPAPTQCAEPNEVPATPRASSARKPKQSKPSS